MKEEIKPRKLSEINSFNGKKVEEGDFLYVSPERKAALLADPYRGNEDCTCQWVGFADDKPAGFNYIFPIRVWADGKSYQSTTGSSLNVEEWARKTSLGMILPAKGVELTGKDGIAIAASCSQMAIPVHKINGYRYFLYPRYIALWRSRSVVESILPRLLSKIASPCIDLGLKCYALALKVLSKHALGGYTLEQVRPDDASAAAKMAEIVVLDTHRFREDHDAAWFSWHLNHSFSSDGPCSGWLLKRKADGAVVGFGLNKRRFYKQASHRGFKNVWLGSVMEWGTVPNAAQMEKGLVLALVLKSVQNCDACDFSTADTTLGKMARHFGWHQVGEANVGVKVMKNFPLFGDKAIREVENWRIRPAMGDNGLS